MDALNEVQRARIEYEMAMYKRAMEGLAGTLESTCRGICTGHHDCKVSVAITITMEVAGLVLVA